VVSSRELQGWTATPEKVEALMPPLDMGQQGSESPTVLLRLKNEETLLEHEWSWEPKVEHCHGSEAIQGLAALEEVPHSPLVWAGWLDRWFQRSGRLITPLCLSRFSARCWRMREPRHDALRAPAGRGGRPMVCQGRGGMRDCPI